MEKGKRKEKDTLFHVKLQIGQEQRSTILPSLRESHWERKSRLFASYNKLQPGKHMVLFCPSPSLLHSLSRLLPQPTCPLPLPILPYYWLALVCHLHFLLSPSSISPCLHSPLPMTNHPIRSPSIAAISCLPLLISSLSLPSSSSFCPLSHLSFPHCFLLSHHLICFLPYCLTSPCLALLLLVWHLPSPSSLPCLSPHPHPISLYCFICCIPVPLSPSSCGPTAFLFSITHTQQPSASLCFYFS